MGDITSLFGKKTIEESNIDKFNALIKGKSDKEIRKIEMALLKPKPLPIPSSNIPLGNVSFIKRSVLFVFPTSKEVDNLNDFIQLNFSNNQKNIYKIKFLTTLLELIKKKRLIWDEEKECYYFNSRSGKRIKL